MTRLLWSQQAVEDVEAVRSYVARDSEHYANLLVERIVAAVDRLLTLAKEMQRRLLHEINPHQHESQYGPSHYLHKRQ